MPMGRQASQISGVSLQLERPEASRPNRVTRLLIPIFLVSGLSSLVYQVIWQRLLTLHYGVGSVSITLIVSVYMLGLGIGALLGGQLAERMRRPLLSYCAVELLIAAFGAVSLPLLGVLARFTAGSSHAVSWLAMFSFLLFPTLLMGATLPLLVKAFNRFARDFLRSVSLLYFVNTLGAALGALVAAYGLITFWGLDVAIYCAVALNLLLAASVYAIGREEPSAPQPASALESEPVLRGGSSLGLRTYPLVFVSGFLAIGYELVWFRLIGILIKASPYAFATSLSVYLLGIALGSYGVERLLRMRPDVPRVGLFFAFQFLTGLSVVALVAGFGYLSDAGPFAQLAASSFRHELHPASWRFADLAGVFLWPVFFQLVPTLLIGASFPLLASLALTRPDREGVTVGRVYFANTLGNLLGGVVCGFVLLASLGTERTLLLFAATNLLLLIFAPRGHGPRMVLRLALVVAAVGGALVVFPGKGQLYRTLHARPGPGFEAFLEEGVDGVVATFERGPRVINYINGLEHGGRPETFFLTQVTEAMATAPRLDEVLIIGFGTGTFTEVVLRSANVKRVTVVELNRTLMRNLTKIAVFRRILDDPRIHFVYDDGRRYLLRTDDRYDLITMDPIRSTTAYSNNLHSLEFFQLASRHLTRCGVFLLWIDDQFIVPRTVASVFPHAALYALPEGTGFVMGSECPLERDPRRLAALLRNAPPGERGVMAQRMRELKPLADGETLLRWTAGLRINRDHRPVSEYYLGRGDLDRLAVSGGR